MRNATVGFLIGVLFGAVLAVLFRGTIGADDGRVVFVTSVST